MKRRWAIQVIVAALKGNEWIVAANGATSRDLYLTQDRRENFYLLGSMGLPAAVGLGLALSQPQRKIIVLDGDGNLLMGFGNLCQVGAAQPKNLYHLVLDNGCYATTGNQATLSSRIDLCQAARSCGYPATIEIKELAELQKIWPTILGEPGPLFMRIKLDPDEEAEVRRIPYSAREIKEHFRSTV